MEVAYKISKNTLTIIDSYKVTSRDRMNQILYDIQYMHQDSNIWLRSKKNLIKEWVSHNRLYKLGLFKSHTKDVDFEYPQKWYYKILYFILGI